jgi:hypothetical protein
LPDEDNFDASRLMRELTGSTATGDRIEAGVSDGCCDGYVLAGDPAVMSLHRPTLALVLLCKEEKDGRTPQGGA